MRNKKFILIFVLLTVAAGAGLYYFKFRLVEDNGGFMKELKPSIGNIQNTISTTGLVLPKNRLEIKPPVNGRIDEILVREGQDVKIGSTLAWMSSTERAALLDAARGQGEEALKYWQDVYKPIPLISPIKGEVIVAKTQPGQTVTTADAVVVLSDQLIVRAQVDETDIGKVKLKQKALIALDAYPDSRINAEVEHLYYESKTVNNVTIYEVDLLPENVPPFFRSGMNTTIDFIVEDRENVLTLPLEAILTEKDGSYVLLKQPEGQEPAKRSIKTGTSDDKNIEIISGIDKDDVVLVKSKKYALPTNDAGGNPFSPFSRRSSSSSSSKKR